MQTTDFEFARHCAIADIRARILRLKWLAAATRFEIALHRHERALKYGFNPGQPRVPRGNSHGGRWTSGDNLSGHRVRLAGEFPSGDSPEFPRERPPTSRDRSAAPRIAARLLGRVGGPVGAIIEAGSWALKYSPLVEAYNDAPKSLEELQRAVSTSRLGYDTHHIVEQTQAKHDGYPTEMIDGPDNLVSIPTMKHWDINRWYQTENPEFNWQTPREYLVDKSWDERTRVGLYALVKQGVLKP